MHENLRNAILQYMKQDLPKPPSLHCPSCNEVIAGKVYVSRERRPSFDETTGQPHVYFIAGYTCSTCGGHASRKFFLTTAHTPDWFYSPRIGALHWEILQEL